MNVALPQDLENYVADLVQTGGYQGLNEVVLEALREHQARRQGREVVMTPSHRTAEFSLPGFPPAQAPNDFPQPQLCRALGLESLNPPPVNASEKSITAPRR